MKLNLGAGTKPIEGYINLDGANGECIYPLQYVDVDEIRASHVLEHFGTEESVDVLCNWHGALKVGGVLKIAVPDFGDLMRRKSLGEDWPYETIIMGGQVDATDYHRSIWDLAKLRTLMEMLGFIELRTWQSEVLDCASYPFSLNIQGVKS